MSVTSGYPKAPIKQTSHPTLPQQFFLYTRFNYLNEYTQ